nr:hypothetical protein CFP56_52005 [Quercus suber]
MKSWAGCSIAAMSWAMGQLAIGIDVVSKGLSFLQQRNGTCHLDILLESSNVLLPASEEDSESRFLTLQWQKIESQENCQKC